jgi:septal ring factor EnvC (AmiA/AmiB activator)
MSRDFDDIRKQIDQFYKEFHKQDNNISKDIKDFSKEQDKIIKDIRDLKKDVYDIGQKIDIILEILNSFTVMLMEEEEGDFDERFNSNDQAYEDGDEEEDKYWLKDEKDFWENTEE